MVIFFAGKYRGIKVYKTYINEKGEHAISGTPYLKIEWCPELFASVAGVKKHINQIYENTKIRSKGPRSGGQEKG